jgi:indole-3-glycerol phosphate synthase
MSAASQTTLDRILAETRVEVQRRKAERPRAALETSAPELARRPFADALARPGMAVIAEFKRRSPSAGSLREAPDLVEIVRAYERGGARALSVLTEGPNFGGSLDDLRAAKDACGLPVLRKDFVVDPYQVHEARAAGADAILLIVAALSQPDLARLHELAGEVGLDVLVEVHDAEELRRAAALGAPLIGVNNRDLRDFSVDVSRTFALLEQMPPGVTVVSESGIAAAEQLAELGRRGVEAVLVGESLMRAEHPEAALRELLAGSWEPAQPARD